MAGIAPSHLLDGSILGTVNSNESPTEIQKSQGMSGCCSPQAERDFNEFPSLGDARADRFSYKSLLDRGRTG